jgi:N-acetyltransferase
VVRIAPIALEGNGVRLEPLAPAHADGLRQAASDGELWTLWYTSVPAPAEVEAYIESALAGQAATTMLPWAVRELATGAIVGSTRYHDIVAAIDRVEIGYTWYAKSWQRSHVNTACKLLLFGHAFDTLGCRVVGLRTDNFNFASQQAIAGLGAKRDGIIRHHQPRRDGTVRDTHMFSVLAAEWPDVKRHLTARIERHGSSRL